MDETLLGKAVRHPQILDTSILTRIDRSTTCDATYGVDLWDCYEVSYLSPSPVTTSLRFSYNRSSPHIVESKSVKLYLQGLNYTEQTRESICEVICADIGEIVKAPITINALPVPLQDERIRALTSKNSVFAKSPDEFVKETLIKAQSFSRNKYEALLSYPHFRSICPVTGQPDWAEVLIYIKCDDYLDEDALLSYLVSYREHGDFHEACADTIYNTVSRHLTPRELTVALFFSRRGGISITPIRSSGDTSLYTRLQGSHSVKIKQ